MHAWKRTPGVFRLHINIAAVGRSGDITLTSGGRQRLDQAGLGRREQLGEHRQAVAASSAELERRVHVDANHLPARCKPQLALAGEQRVPGFMFLAAAQGVLAIGAELSVGSGLTSGAGQVVVATGPAVFGPSARLEVPAAEGPHAFFAAFSNTWRSVNSWKNRSPTG